MNTRSTCDNNGQLSGPTLLAFKSNTGLLMFLDPSSRTLNSEDVQVWNIQNSHTQVSGHRHQMKFVTISLCLWQTNMHTKMYLLRIWLQKHQSHWCRIESFLAVICYWGGWGDFNCLKNRQPHCAQAEEACQGGYERQNALFLNGRCIEPKVVYSSPSLRPLFG